MGNRGEGCMVGVEEANVQREVWGIRAAAQHSRAPMVQFVGLSHMTSEWVVVQQAWTSPCDVAAAQLHPEQVYRHAALA